MHKNNIYKLIPVIYALILLASLLLFIYSADYAKNVQKLENACNDYWVAEIERLCIVSNPSFVSGQYNVFNITKVQNG